MTPYLKRLYASKSEIALTGLVTMLNTMSGNKEETIFIVDYILNTLGMLTENENGTTVYQRAMEFCDEGTTVVGISTSVIAGVDRCINLILEPKGETVNIEDTEGCFCYVYNIDCPWCSELGYAFFEKKLSSYHRIA